MLTLADVFESITDIRPDWAGQVIAETSIDSRQVKPGAMFVALPGERVDGHDFVGAAFDKGAVLALIQREVDSQYPVIDLREITETHLTQPQRLPLCLFVRDSLQAMQQVARFWRRKLDLHVVSITGSVGKSTTKELVAEVLENHFRTLKNPGNLNNEIGLPLTLLSLGSDHEVAVLELGFYVPGEIAFLCDLALPQIGVLTNVGTVHAERAGSQEAIAKGKAELVEALPPAPTGVAILNYDDLRVRDMAQFTSQMPG